MIEGVSGILIAGGKSRRMGQDKRFMKVSGESVFERTVSVLRSIFAENIVVLAEPIERLAVQDCSVVYDVIPNAGSLGGIYTGLMAVTQPRIFAVACDMPFLDTEIIRFMASYDDTADIVVAQLSGKFHPTHALYSKRCIPFLRVMAERNQLRIQELFQQEDLRIAILGENELLPFASRVRSFRNINTPDDLASVESQPSIER